MCVQDDIQKNLALKLVVFVFKFVLKMQDLTWMQKRRKGKIQQLTKNPPLPAFFAPIKLITVFLNETERETEAQRW